MNSKTPTPEFLRAGEFQAELDGLLATYAGRPTPLTFARRMTEDLGGAKIYLKREDLAHTGAHKVNNVDRAVPARALYGKTARDRGDGCGPARRCNGYGLCVVESGMRSLHGRRKTSSARLSMFFGWSCSALVSIRCRVDRRP